MRGGPIRPKFLRSDHGDSKQKLSSGGFVEDGATRNICPSSLTLPKKETFLQKTGLVFVVARWHTCSLNRPVQGMIRLGLHDAGEDGIQHWQLLPSSTRTQVTATACRMARTLVVCIKASSCPGSDCIAKACVYSVGNTCRYALPCSVNHVPFQYKTLWIVML